jgi:hypothetical protein
VTGSPRVPKRSVVVRRPSIGKRLIVWMPDWPAVSFAQLSSLPWPREVTTPMPVTTTTGRPCLSFIEAILLSSDPIAIRSDRSRFCFLS